MNDQHPVEEGHPASCRPAALKVKLAILDQLEHNLPIGGGEGYPEEFVYRVLRLVYNFDHEYALTMSPLSEAFRIREHLK